MPETKLTQEQIALIRSGAKSDLEFAQEYGYHVSYINGIRLGHYLRDPGVPAPERNHRSGGAQTNFSQPCECGCGEMTTPGARFVYRHQYGVIKPPSPQPLTDAEWISDTFSQTIPTDCGYKTMCLLWPGPTNPKGYATATRGGKTSTRPRMVYELIHGVKLPRKVAVIPLCGQKTCMRPDHLALNHHGPRKAYCTSAEVAHMKELRAQGLPYKEIQALYPQYKNAQSILNIVRGKRMGGTGGTDA